MTSIATMVLVPDESLPRVILPDYDGGPGRFRLARAVLRRHALAPDVHERVARRLAGDGLTPVLDVSVTKRGALAFRTQAVIGNPNSPGASRARFAVEPEYVSEATERGGLLVVHNRRLGVTSETAPFRGEAAL